MKKRKILHLITHTAVGGSQDNTFCTCALHDRACHEVHLASHPGGPWAERARSSCDVFHALPSLVTPMSPGKDLRALLEIFRLLRRRSPAPMSPGSRPGASPVNTSRLLSFQRQESSRQP